MFYPHTERQEQFLAVADDLAARFAGRAGEQDRSGRFPQENFAEIRAAGLPALVVPEAHGGWGATLPDTVMTMARLAVGDGSTALGLTMHMQTLGSAAEAGTWPPEIFAALCRAVVEQGALINSAATEPELGSPSRGGKPRTTASPLHDCAGNSAAWVIEGVKSFASMFPALDYLLIPATLQDGSDDVGRFLVPCGADAGNNITVARPWDAMGMRTTGSHDIRLTDVQVPAET